MDSPGSPLSDLSSDDFAEDVKADDRSISVDTFHAADHEGGRPAKRQRTGPPGLSNHRATSVEAPLIIDADPDIYLSEDTEGSVPASPSHPSGFGGMQDEESLGQEQVTTCKWDGCEAGDLGNMDNLVEHLHDDHIGTRQKKYSCEWSDCSRKGIPHASGYALRAHMRSHTREKPFYCTLPECDRAFTRSDALAKHMRTVHETEALRPSDPVPKHHSSNPSNKAQRLRLVFKKTPGANGTEKSATPVPMSPQHDSADNKPPIDDSYENHNVIYIASADGAHNIPLKEFPVDIQFSPQELSMPAPTLMRLLKRQVEWATEEAEEIKAEVEALERSRKDEWAAKELALENLMEIEQLRMEQLDRSLVNEGQEFIKALREDVRISKMLEIQPLPAWRLTAGELQQQQKDGEQQQQQQHEQHERQEQEREEREREMDGASALAGLASVATMTPRLDAAADRDRYMPDRPENPGADVAGY